MSFDQEPVELGISAEALEVASKPEALEGAVELEVTMALEAHPGLGNSNAN